MQKRLVWYQVDPTDHLLQPSDGRESERNCQKTVQITRWFGLAYCCLTALLAQIGYIVP